MLSVELNMKNFFKLTAEASIMNNTTHNQAINEAAAQIAKYNPQLATLFKQNPLKRVEYAMAFSRGFVKNTEDDAPSFCYTIINIAMLSKQIYLNNLAAQEKQ